MEETLPEQVQVLITTLVGAQRWEELARDWRSPFASSGMVPPKNSSIVCLLRSLQALTVSNTKTNPPAGHAQYARG